LYYLDLYNFLMLLYTLNCSFLNGSSLFGS
jgi:hypothetical protein